MRRLVLLRLALAVAVAFACGTVNVLSTDTVGTTKDLVTTFTPQALLMWTTGRSETTDAAGGSNIRHSVGMATGDAARRAAAGYLVDAAASSDSQKYHTDAAVIVSIDGAAAVDGALDINASGFMSDRIRLVVDDQFPVTLELHWCAWGGLDWAELVAFQEPGAIGDQDITVSSGRPDAVLFTSIRFSTAPPAGSTAAAHLLLGMAAHPDGGSVTQAVTYSADDSGSTSMEEYHVGRNDLCIALINDSIPATPTYAGRASYVQSQATGFRLNWASREFTAHIFALALKGGGQWHVGEGLWPTTGGGTVDVTAGFQPIGGLVIAAKNGEESGTTMADDIAFSVGAWSSTTNRSACAAFGDDAAADANLGTAVEHDAIAAVLDATPAVVARLDIDSVLSTGARYAADTADGIAHWFAVLHVGAGATGTPISQALAVPYEALALAGQSGLTPWEALSLALQSQLTPWEALTSIAGSQLTSYESLALAVQEQLTAWESAGTITGEQLTPWESGGTATQTQGTPWESLTTSVQSQNMSWESLTSALQSLASQWESLAQTTRAQEVAWEATGLVSVSQAATIVYESLATLLVERATPWESVATLSVGQVTSWESLRSLEQSLQSMWESLVSLSTTQPIAWESAGKAFVPPFLATLRMVAVLAAELRMSPMFDSELVAKAAYEAEVRAAAALDADVSAKPVLDGGAS